MGKDVQSSHASRRIEGPAILVSNTHHILWNKSTCPFESHVPQNAMCLQQTSEVNWAATVNDSWIVCHIAIFCQRQYLRHCHFINNTKINSRIATKYGEHSSPATLKRNDSFVTLTRFPHNSQGTSPLLLIYFERLQQFWGKSSVWLYSRRNSMMSNYLGSLEFCAGSVPINLEYQKYWLSFLRRLFFWKLACSLLRVISNFKCIVHIRTDLLLQLKEGKPVNGPKTKCSNSATVT